MTNRAGDRTGREAGVISASFSERLQPTPPPDSPSLDVGTQPVESGAVAGTPGLVGVGAGAWERDKAKLASRSWGSWGPLVRVLPQSQLNTALYFRDSERTTSTAPPP